MILFDCVCGVLANTCLAHRGRKDGHKHTDLAHSSVFLTNSDQDIKPHCEEEQGGGWEERRWVMIQRLLLAPLPRRGGLQEKGEAKRADREKQASPHFPVCVVFGQSKKSQHAHTKTDTHHHVSDWLRAQSEDVRGQRPQQPNHLRLLLHSAHVGRWTERSRVTDPWAPMLDDCRAAGASQNPAQLQYWEKIIWYILIVSGFKVTFHKNERSQQIFSTSSFRQSHKQTLLSVETANKYLIQRSAGRSCSCCCWSVKKEQSFILYFVKLLSLLVNLLSRPGLLQPTCHQSAFDRCKQHPRPATCSWEQLWKLYDGYGARKETFTEP